MYKKRVIQIIILIVTYKKWILVCWFYRDYFYNKERTVEREKFSKFDLLWCESCKKSDYTLISVVMRRIWNTSLPLCLLMYLYFWFSPRTTYIQIWYTILEMVSQFILCYTLVKVQLCNIEPQSVISPIRCSHYQLVIYLVFSLLIRYLLLFIFQPYRVIFHWIFIKWWKKPFLISY